MHERSRSTLWTSKMSDWSSPFRDVEISVELEQRIVESVNRASELNVRERVKPYETPVTQEALKFAVK